MQVLRQLHNEIEHGIYFIFEMEIVSGGLIASSPEISEVEYRAIDDVLLDPQVVSLTKEIVSSFKTVSPNSGLWKLDSIIQTNNKYINYDAYTLS